ncbi:cysteine desulfurase family protein [Piscibacillus salipiscarius]|uniref:cysteine desulfurase family protein n=1 Tax=Piscibacillus salipiscarius TaxID=299480 RepID=UPI0006D1D5FE|nr:aminotransferase class V-fold PLP-dependent enzyme [Piscibacillus salipiscarius]
MSVSQKYYANTNSLHEMGEQSKQLYDQCRTHLGSLIGSNPDQLFFTKGGSEANILAIESLLKRHHGKHIIVSQAEHNSIIEMCHQKEREGYNVTYLSFNQNGQVDLTELNSELRYDTAVVIVQHVNGEIGTIQPVEEIANICKQNGVFFHVDAVQSFGRLKLSHLPERVDSLSVSSHKVYGPKGVGLLYLNEANNKGIERLLLKGNTIDLPSVAAFTVAAYEIIKQQTFEETRLSKLRNQLINELEVIHNDLTMAILIKRKFHLLLD